MSEPLFAAAILLLVGAATGWSGYAIKYQRKYHLIAGFDAARARDPVALAGWIGTGGLLIAAVCAIAAFAVLVAPDALPVIVAAAGITTGAAAVVTAAGAIGRGR